MASNRQRLQKIFGFYPEPFQLNAGSVTITPLPEFEQSIADTLASDHIEKDWIYAPPQQTREFGSGEVRDCPYSARVFGLSKTHLIEHTAATGEEHLDFHLWALSFFMGMRLTATEAGFLDATPLKAGKLVDFVLQGSSLTLAVELADDFWRTNHHDPRRARLFAGAVHALFLAQNPRSLQFERFVYLYTATDACYALAKEILGTKKFHEHSKRIAWMCRKFCIEIPVWANSNASKGAR